MAKPKHQVILRRELIFLHLNWTKKECFLVILQDLFLSFQWIYLFFHFPSFSSLFFTSFLPFFLCKLSVCYMPGTKEIRLLSQGRFNGGGFLDVSTFYKTSMCKMAYGMGGTGGFSQRPLTLGKFSLPSALFIPTRNSSKVVQCQGAEYYRNF